MYDEVCDFPVCYFFEWTARTAWVSVKNNRGSAFFNRLAHRNYFLMGLSASMKPRKVRENDDGVSFSKCIRLD